MNIHHAFWSILTTSKYQQFPRKRNVEVKCQILAKAMYSSNNSGVVGNWVILCTLNVRKQNYSGAKWRLSCNVCWNLIRLKVSPWHRNVNTFEEREILNARVVTWCMGSGLKAQNMTGIRAQRKGLRAQKNGIRDHKAFEAESGIRFITRSKNLLSQYFSA